MRHPPGCFHALLLDRFHNQRAGDHFRDRDADGLAAAEGRALRAALNALQVGLVGARRQRHVIDLLRVAGGVNCCTCGRRSAAALM